MTKRIILCMTVFILCLSMLASPAFAQSVEASRTSSTVLVDGKEIVFDAYNISGSNYFKLRDIAAALNGTPKQVEIGYDNATKSVSITTGVGYTAMGGELAAPSGAAVKPGVLSDSQFVCNGTVIELTAYLIDGNNYIKLRDLGQVIDFGVEWNEASQTISILTDRGYTAEGQGAQETGQIGTIYHLEQAAVNRELIGSWPQLFVIAYTAIDESIFEDISIAGVKVDGQAAHFAGINLEVVADAVKSMGVAGEGALLIVFEVHGEYQEGTMYEVEIESLITYADGEVFRLIDTFTWNFDGSGGFGM